MITPELRAELDLLKNTLQRLSDVTHLDPNISDAELVKIARAEIEIHEAFKSQPRIVFGTPETPR